MLQNIMDLMAFSLQTLRVTVTYDQIPTLVRRGLITLAIDGFDELGDPNSYELAWAQVNELVTSVRGAGSLVLAGRETFIGRDRLLKALVAYRPTSDRLYDYTVHPLTPSIARDWLRDHGWTDEVLAQDNVEPLFESGSYALRPFFLEELAREGVSDQVASGSINDLLWFLVEIMIEREATKFGRDVKSVTTDEDRRNFLRTFLGEVARDLAENQTEAISGDSLAWIAEYVASRTVPSSLIGVLRNRAGVVAFLADDDRLGYKRFSHAQILNHFLSRITIDAVLAGEIPKYVRRNIFGADFLSSFVEVASNIESERILSFLHTATERIRELTDQDRLRRNLASLVLSSTGVVGEEFDLRLSEVAIDEVLASGTPSKTILEGVLIAQLDARRTDLRAWEFVGTCHVLSLIADDETVLPDGFPHPQTVQMQKRVLTIPAEIDSWIQQHSASGQTEKSSELIRAGVRHSGLIQVLQRAVRYRSYWIRDDDDDRLGRRILGDPNWPMLYSLLQRHHLLVQTVRQVSGKNSQFYHIRRRDEILNEAVDEPEIRSFYLDLIAEVERRSV